VLTGEIVQRADPHSGLAAHRPCTCGPVRHEPRPPRSRGRGRVPSPALRYGDRWVYGARAPVTLERLCRERRAPPSRHPHPPRQPGTRAPRAGLRGGFGLDGDFGGLQAPKISAQPKVSKIFPDHRLRLGRARSLRLLRLPAPPAGPWPSGARAPLATGGPRAPGHRGRACPWSGERARGPGHGRSQIDRGLDSQAVARVDAAPSCGPGCHEPRTRRATPP